MLFNYVYRSNDIEAATTAKFRVEQKQRDEAKLRKDENTAWANTVSVVDKSILFEVVMTNWMA